MRSHKTIGTVALILGVVLLGSSMYIKSEVLAGQEQVASGERKLNALDRVFSSNSATKSYGSQITKSGRSKIAQGKEEIAYYTSLANKLQIGGIVLIVVGAGFLLFGKKKR
jgi:hypothetical protein